MKDYGLKPLQMKILEIMIYIDRLCKENNIQYYLMGGSALGAIRHSGFIPWDDDLDVFMTYDNYCKFIDVCKKQLDTDTYHLQEENSNEWPMFFTKIRMNGTAYIENVHEPLSIHQGIFVDIFCLNNIKNINIESKLQYICARLLTAQGLGKKKYQTDSMIKKIVINMMLLISNRTISKFLLQYVRKFNNKNCEYVAHFFGKSPYKNAIFKKEYLGQPRYVKFENIELPVPQYVEKYLETRFGDYMTLPPEEDISTAQHALKVDLNKDYREYIG